MKHWGTNSLLLLAASITISFPSSDRCCAQELSTDVFPSEDELRQALALGEIEYEQFLRMLEIAQFGIDSTTPFLYDQIPNLTHFQPLHDSLVTPLESSQSLPFSPEQRTGRKRNMLRYRFLEELDENNRDGYRVFSRIEPSPEWSASFRVHRDFSGRERFVARSIGYRPSRGSIRSLTVGTFTRRFGLGTVIGYRGKLLDRTDQLSTESFFFPDYGGFNGMLLEGKAGSLGFAALGSYNRDRLYSHAVTGGMIRRKRGLFRPGFLYAVNRLENRTTHSVIYDWKAGVHSEFRYRNGYAGVEVSGQVGDLGQALAAVVEGRHRLVLAEIRYAGWAYANDYYDLSSGSKAANINSDIDFDHLDTTFSSKRSGQQGGLVRTTVLLAERLRLTGSVLYGQRGRDTCNVELSSALIRDLSPSLSLQIDYLSKTTKRTTISARNETDKQRTRLEARFATGQVTLRNYIAYNTRHNDCDYYTLFVSVSADTKALGLLELWSNLGRVARDGIEYWYFFVRNEQPLLADVQIATKFGNAYSRGAKNKYQPIISVELTAQL